MIFVLPNEGDYMVEAMHSGPHFEAMGWDGLWLSDHLLGITEDHLHKQAWMDIMVSMAHLAARTTHVRIGAGVLVLPYRDPVLTARMVATLGPALGWSDRSRRRSGLAEQGVPGARRR